MTGAHRMPPHRHRPNPVEAHQQREVPQVYRWARPQPAGRHRTVSARSVAGLAWPGEVTTKLMRVRRSS